MTLTEQLHATRVDLWGDVGAERYGDVIEALHLFAQVTDCPPGASVVNWFSTQADRLEAAERRQSTHPAAPSADKLRIAVEALEPFSAAFRGLSSRWEGHETHWQDATSPIAVEDLRRADQALDALKAGGA